MKKELLVIENLTVRYGQVEILKNINLIVHSQEILCIVGESGCGKSTLLSSISGLLDSGATIASGEIYFDERELTKVSQEELRQLRGRRMGVVFQNPGTSLNPIRKIGSQFLEAIRSHYPISTNEGNERILKMLEKLSLRDGKRILQSYPFELSGGMNQRIAIALAMIMEPDLLLADEPTSALDVTVQAQVIKEMLKLRDTFSTSIILVTHSMGIVAQMADQVGVMYSGEIVEYGSKANVLRSPLHPYTKALINAVPSLVGSIPQGIPGSPPSFGVERRGCSFAERCTLRESKCFSQKPKLREIRKGHWSACWRY
ncbi:MAG: ABC transporter ATP-binding protein [Desulfitobacterium sp.]|nr:ABC transporter ATP-binding protein [Desulfitobacterium sp.]